MPITIDRVNDLLTEHEAALDEAREVYEGIKGILTDTNYTSAEARLYDISGIIPKLINLPDTIHFIERRLYKRNIKRNIRMRDKMRQKRLEVDKPIDRTMVLPLAPQRDIMEQLREHRAAKAAETNSFRTEAETGKYDVAVKAIENPAIRRTQILREAHELCWKAWKQRGEQPFPKSTLLEFAMAHNMVDTEVLIRDLLEQNWIEQVEKDKFVPRDAVRDTRSKNEKFLASLPKPEVKSEEAIAAEALAMLE